MSAFQKLTELIKENGKKQTLAATAARLLYSLFSVNIISLLVLNYGVQNEEEKIFFYGKALFESVSFANVALYTVLFFIGFTLLSLLTGKEAWEKAVLFVTYFLYSLICTLQYGDIWFYAGAILGLLAVCVYVFGDERTSPFSFRLPKWGVLSLVAVCGICFAVWIGIQSVCRVLTLSSPNFDFGIFSQMFYNMKETLIPATTCERDIYLSHFSVHVSPIYYLYLPFYALFPSPITLQICQAVMLASGVIPVYLLSKKLRLSGKAAVVFAACYAFFPALSGGCYYDVHENKFLAPLLLWLFYFILSDRLWGVVLFSLLTCFVKEDAPIYVIFASLYVLLGRKERQKGFAMLAISAAYFAGVIWYLEKYGYAGIMSNRYSNFIFEEDGGLISVVKAMIVSPFNVIKECFETNSPGENDPSKIEFIIKMLAPLGFLPVITKKASRYILLCPMILVNLMSDYVYQHTVDYQYTYGTMAFLVFAAMLNYADFTPRYKRTAGAFAVCSALLLYLPYVSSKPDYAEKYRESPEEYDEVRHALESIPEDASVQASTFLVVPCSNRAQVYDRDHYAKKTFGADYVALDLRYESSVTELEYDYKRNSDYELVCYIEGRLAILKYIGE